MGYNIVGGFFARRICCTSFCPYFYKEVLLMQYQLVADSSANVLSMPDVSYASVPMKIITREKEYVDDDHLDVEQMVLEIEKTPGPSGSSCPNITEWQEAFGGADNVFAVAITSNLSGACSSAQQAAASYMKKNPEAKVCVIDSLSTGPEMRLLLEKIRQGVLASASFERIKSMIEEYSQHTHLLFMLHSMTNLARNGRVNPAVAKIASVLGICVVGRASDHGTLEQLSKNRGEKKALAAILSEMTKAGFAGKKVRISHCMNLEGARKLKERILELFPHSDVQIDECRGLCSFYAEKGGLIIGFEDSVGNLAFDF